MILKSASASRSFVLGNSKRVCRSVGKVRVEELGSSTVFFLTLHAHLSASAEKLARVVVSTQFSTGHRRTRLKLWIASCYSSFDPYNFARIL